MPRTPRPNRQQSPPRTSFGRRAASDATRAPGPASYVGIAHVAFGALGLTTGVFGIFFAVNGIARWLLAAHVVMVVLAGLTILAGLWLYDGRRHGALLAGATDGLRLLLALLVSEPISLDVLVPAGLLGAIIWLWPDLERSDV